MVRSYQRYPLITDPSAHIKRLRFRDFTGERQRGQDCVITEREGEKILTRLSHIFLRFLRSRTNLIIGCPVVRWQPFTKPILRSLGFERTSLLFRAAADVTQRIAINFISAHSSVDVFDPVFRRRRT
jgi:hypothetical protein